MTEISRFGNGRLFKRRQQRRHSYTNPRPMSSSKTAAAFFFAGQDGYSADEIECAKEIKTAEQLNVELPADNLDFNKLAKALTGRGFTLQVIGDARRPRSYANAIHEAAYLARQI